MSKPRVLFVLQNAWRIGATEGDRVDDWRSWELALWRSQTGKRLREMIPESVEYRVCNGSPFVGSTSRSKYLADVAYVEQRIAEFRPLFAVLFGGASSLHGHLSIATMPARHPAWRLWTKHATAQLNDAIATAADAIARSRMPRIQDLAGANHSPS